MANDGGQDLHPPRQADQRGENAHRGSDREHAEHQVEAEQLGDAEQHGQPSPDRPHVVAPPGRVHG
jgi:hypothetical protein